LDLVDRLVAEMNPGAILEIGCGQGAFGARFAARAAYVGVEPDEAAYEVARHRVEPAGGTVIRGTDAAVPVGSEFDLVCFFEVLEHIRDDDDALRRWTTFARPGGHVLLSVPAFARRFGPMDVQAGHYRRYDPDEIRRALVSAGLEDVRVIVYGWPLGYALEAVRNRFSRRALAGMERVPSPEEFTAASGRWMQPSNALLAASIAAGTLPFRRLQRLVPTRGTGLVAIGRRPTA
jgi:SAM-dependent methyltransferase